jgi:hypothetical protein
MLPFLGEMFHFVFPCVPQKGSVGKRFGGGFTAPVAQRARGLSSYITLFNLGASRGRNFFNFYFVAVDGRLNVLVFLLLFRKCFQHQA